MKSRKILNMKVKTEYFYQSTSSGNLPLYCARPKSGTSTAAIIVLQEAFGVNGHIQEICHRLAHLGYVAVAPELFHRQGQHIIYDYSDRKSAMSILKTLTNDEVAADISQTLKFLYQRFHIDQQQVATLGFCMGGHASVLAACRFKINNAISFYGAGLLYNRVGIGLQPLRNEFMNISCPLLLFFGGLDASIPASEVRDVKMALEDAQVSYQAQIFANANHGFFCHQRRSYHAVAAHEAWGATIQWLNNLLPRFKKEESQLIP
jgi:carboxymethylenebutenolidase